MKNKRILIYVLAIMTLGFATVATTLLINGSIKIGTNTSDFEVVFSSASVDGDGATYNISDDKKTLTFSTGDLKSINDVSSLYYTITNNSTYYNADISFNCVASDTNYVSFVNSITEDTIKPQKSLNGSITATLIKNVDTVKEITYTCTLDVNASEIDNNTYELSGILTDDEGNPISNASLAVYSETPHYVTTNEAGVFTVSGLESGRHEVFYIAYMSIDELKTLSKEETKARAELFIFNTSSVEGQIENGAYELIYDIHLFDKAATTTTSPVTTTTQKPSRVSYLQGDGTTVGDKFKIDNSEFIVMSNDGTKTTAMYLTPISGVSNPSVARSVSWGVQATDGYYSTTYTYYTVDFNNFYLIANKADLGIEKDLLNNFSYKSRIMYVHPISYEDAATYKTYMTTNSWLPMAATITGTSTIQQTGESRTYTSQNPYCVVNRNVTTNCTNVTSMYVVVQFANSTLKSI